MTHGAPSNAIDPAVAESLKAFAIKTVPFFKALTHDDLIIRQIKGGTTNQLYMLRNISVGPIVKKAADGAADESAPAEGAEVEYPKVTPDGFPTAIVVRMYGKGTEKMISREEELFWQSQFLETYGANKEMLAYEYLDGFRALRAEEFFPRRHQIARRMAAFHAKATQAASFRPPSMGSVNQTYVMMNNWADLIADLDKVRSMVAPEKVHMFDQMGFMNGGLARERDWLLSIINKNLHRLPTAVCHNDFTCGNFMLNETKGAEELRFIDFEYTRLNFTYFDIANHFCEYGGLECDFSKFPERPIVAEFIREYLEAGRKRSVISGYVGQKSSSTNVGADISSYSPLKTRPRFDFGSNTFDFGASPNASTSEHTSIADPPHEIPAYSAQQRQAQQAMLQAVTDAEVEEATDFVYFFALISHFTWTFWGLIQEMSSEIDFGFIDYAWGRYEEYLKRREEWSKKFV